MMLATMFRQRSSKVSFAICHTESMSLAWKLRVFYLGRVSFMSIKLACGSLSAWNWAPRKDQLIDAEFLVN